MMRVSQRGFTLIEMLVVVIIISVLAAIGAPQYFKVVERARMVEATAMLGTIRSAQERILARDGSYANDNNGMSKLDINIQGKAPTFGMRNFIMMLGPGINEGGCGAGMPFYNIAFVRITNNAGVVPRYFENYMVVYERCSDTFVFPGCANCTVDFR
jgi:prepilin-type N-terminal cleavage/methylation domain-containing protein